MEIIFKNDETIIDGCGDFVLVRGKGQLIIDTSEITELEDHLERNFKIDNFIFWGAGSTFRQKFNASKAALKYIWNIK